VKEVTPRSVPLRVDADDPDACRAEGVNASRGYPGGLGTDDDGVERSGAIEILWFVSTPHDSDLGIPPGGVDEARLPHSASSNLIRHPRISFGILESHSASSKVADTI
jgi:hypothetical protein